MAGRPKGSGPPCNRNNESNRIEMCRSPFKRDWEAVEHAPETRLLLRVTPHAGYAAARRRYIVNANTEFFVVDITVSGGY